MMSRGVIIIALAVALAHAGAAAQSVSVVGKWAVSQSRCDSETIAFEADGAFTSTLDDNQPRAGKYRTGRDRIILLDEQEPDRELALIIIDFSPTRLVAFDETIESDRRLVKCR
ncbi:hypothetical protein FNB15_14895 [Ferrovibrio terrae]|uniref:Uncharacterized protein n=1 Tax=Ferrovibrio terrae TaxID=2594003 RepID=A0A516H3Y6_9PROT|nr:hypothetical protein [Ferrovibrio terrae]QDO98486.1 hypothetical protein FNB15_14895 [Ferrovibrio terrae]